MASRMMFIYSSVIILTCLLCDIDCFEIPDDIRDRLPDGFPDNLPTFPTLPPNLFDNLTISPICAEELTRMFDDGRSDHATLALDAWGKLQPGFLAGNLAWLGHYPECKSLSDYHFCMAYLKLNITYAVSPVMRWGMCVPENCDESDVATSIQEIIDKLEYNELETLNPQVTNVLCATSPPRPYDPGFYATATLCCVAAFLMVAGALLDAHQKRAQRRREQAAADDAETLLLLRHSNPQNGGTFANPDKEPQKMRRQSLLHRFLLCFSFTRNVRAILRTETKEGSMLCLNGIRVISMTWVILGHTILMLYTIKGFAWDGIYGLELIKTFPMQAIVNAFPAVDSFFFLSGLLLVYISLGRMARSGGKLPWGLFYFHRYWRLLPGLGFAMLFATYLMPYFGEGPVWPAATTSFGPKCEKYWWTNLLYINNFYPERAESGCIYWVWYLANDMQFYLISPIILIALHRKPLIGLLILVVLCVASLATTIALMVVNDFKVALMGYLGPQDGSGNNIFSKLYVKPYCRITPYLIGMALGYALHRWRGKRVRMNKIVVIFGWLAAVGTGLAVVYGLYGELNGRPLSTAENAIYMAFGHLAWACALAWLVFACHYGYGGWVNDFLSWRAWLPLCRLTYCAYLFHPMVLSILQGNTAHALSLNPVYYSYYFVGSCVFSYSLAFLVSLTIEIPLANLEGILK